MILSVYQAAFLPSLRPRIEASKSMEHTFISHGSYRLSTVYRYWFEFNKLVWYIELLVCYCYVLCHLY